MADAPKKIKKVVVNRDLCIGAGTCVVNAPTVFELDTENKAILLQKLGVKTSGPAERGNLTDGALDDATILAAANSCPTKAIQVYDEDGTLMNP